MRCLECSIILKIIPTRWPFYWWAVYEVALFWRYLQGGISIDELFMR